MLFENFVTANAERAFATTAESNTATADTRLKLPETKNEIKIIGKTAVAKEISVVAIILLLLKAETNPPTEFPVNVQRHTDGKTKELGSSNPKTKNGKTSKSATVTPNPISPPITDGKRKLFSFAFVGFDLFVRSIYINPLG